MANETAAPKARRYKRRGRPRSPIVCNVPADALASILEAQRHVCAGCGQKPGRYRLCRDHDHSCCGSKTIINDCCFRGFLCRRCNLGIAQLKDNPATLRALADYLEAYGERRAGLS